VNIINIYDYHSEPETLFGYSERFKIPKFAFYETRRRWGKKKYKENQQDLIKYFINDPMYAYLFTKGMIQKPYPPAEPGILKSSHYSTQYAIEILHGRFPEAEELIASDPKTAYLYATRVIEGRWPQGEPAMMKDPNTAYDYAYVILGQRWPEAEPYIKQDENAWGAYKQAVIKDKA